VGARDERDNDVMVPSQTLFADRSERAKIRVTGDQRAWFLHQVLTQAFEDMAVGEAREAAMLTPHGRMTGHLEVLAAEDAFLAHFEPDLREILPAELRRYVFATRADIEDVTEAMGLVLVCGPGWAEAAAGLDVVVHPTLGLGVPAAYLWVERGRVDELCNSLEARGPRRVREEELEAVRIANGLPRWGREMDHRTLPQEAGIDERAVHYDKGCYLGQEAMAKIHFRGRVNRRLRRLSAEQALSPGADVFLAGQKVGRVTSAADGTALAILRRTVEDGARVRAGDVEATVVG
jgi:folate-binding protein YgfZ